MGWEALQRCIFSLNRWILRCRLSLSLAISFASGSPFIVLGCTSAEFPNGVVGPVKAMPQDGPDVVGSWGAPAGEGRNWLVPEERSNAKGGVAEAGKGLASRRALRRLSSTSSEGATGSEKGEERVRPLMRSGIAGYSEAEGSMGGDKRQGTVSQHLKPCTANATGDSDTPTFAWRAAISFLAPTYIVRS